MTSTLRHRPWLNAGAGFEIGLRPMDMAQWLDIGPDHATFMAAKRARLAGCPPLYYRTLETSRPAQAELLALALHNLRTHHAAADPGETLPEGREPLDVLGSIVEEDFVLFGGEGARGTMIAASNAYTSSGRIVSCVGRGMHFAHEPVPGLNAELAPRIDRVIGNVQAGKPVVRFNWFITPIASRLFPEGSHEANIRAGEAAARRLAEDHRRAGETLWLRVERQSFVRLPETGALAFGIHTYSDPLSAIANDHDSLAALQRLLESYSEARLAYGGMLATRPAILAWIADRLSA